MKITDIFIRRPVLATVVSLLILVGGLRSIGSLPIRQFPFTENSVITVSTYYIGADPATIAGFITTPLENSIAQASGIDYMISSSVQNSSIINVNLLLNYDSNAALSDINSKINAVLNQLPPASQQPSLAITTGETIDSMYIAFYSQVLANNQITDYLVRVVQPKLQAVNGVQNAEILGQRQLAMRIWLDPLKMAALGVTAADVSTALRANDFISTAGRTDGNMMTINLSATTGLHSVEQFKNLIIKSQNNAIVRIGDVANVTLGAQNYNTAVSFDTQDAIYIGIKVAPKANLLTVINAIKTVFPSIQQQLPEGLKTRIVYDATAYVHSSIYEVVKSLIEALVIVTIVIFLFLGSIRSVIIPSVTIPLSLIGIFFTMLLFHFSINLLTLLALVLSIGLVVDDAIIIVENVQRHIENGIAPLDAALLGARELANPIVAITVVLIAVYLPIGFMGGLTGALFTEFAFTLAGAVTLSAIIALSLSPMMCSKMLKPQNIHKHHNKIFRFFDLPFEKLRAGYERYLHRTLDFLGVIIVFAFLIFCSIYFLYTTSKSELAPMEDQGVIISQITAAPNASLTQTRLFSQQMAKNFLTWPEVAHTFELDGANGFNSSIVGGVLKPWDQRHQTEMSLAPQAQKQLNEIPGIKAAAFELPPLPGGGRGLPVQFIIQTANPFESLNDIAQKVIQEGWKSGKFLYLDSDLKIDKQQITLQLDRNKISQMGLTMQEVGDVLSASLSQNYINYFSLDGRSYQVIPETKRMQRLNFNQILNYYIRTPQGMVPLSTVVKFRSTVAPEQINHFQQLNSATISAIPAPGVTQGEALNTLNSIAKQQLTPEYTINYASQSRQYVQESSALIFTFFFALIVIYLSLGVLLIPDVHQAAIGNPY